MARACTVQFQFFGEKKKKKIVGLMVLAAIDGSIVGLVMVEMDDDGMCDLGIILVCRF